MLSSSLVSFAFLPIIDQSLCFLFKQKVFETIGHQQVYIYISSNNLSQDLQKGVDLVCAIINMQKCHFDYIPWQCKELLVHNFPQIYSHA